MHKLGARIKGSERLGERSAAGETGGNPAESAAVLVARVQHHTRRNDRWTRTHSRPLARERHLSHNFHDAHLCVYRRVRSHKGYLKHTYQDSKVSVVKVGGK